MPGTVALLRNAKVLVDDSVLAAEHEAGSEPALSSTAVRRNEKTTGKLLLTDGSNVHHLAETEGFEPSRGVNPYLLSREAHSTWLCDVSRPLNSSR